MEQKKVIFKNGQLWDTATNKRIHLKDGASIEITLDESDLIQNHINPSASCRGHDELVKTLEQNKDISSYAKIIPAGSLLYFNIEITNTAKQGYHIQKKTLQFQVKLYEDLFLYKKTGGKSQNYKLYPCHCVVENEVTHKLAFFEPVTASSLNHAYTKTYVTYFQSTGNPACNAFDKFYTFEKDGAKKKIAAYRDLIEYQGKARQMLDELKKL